MIKNKQNIHKQRGFISKLALFLLSLTLLADVFILDNTLSNFIKEKTPIIIKEAKNRFKDFNEDIEEDKVGREVSKHNYTKEDIRYSKNCEEIVKDMGMGDKLIKKRDKSIKIRYNQTNAANFMITINKNGSCSIEET